MNENKNHTKTLAEILLTAAAISLVFIFVILVYIAYKPAESAETEDIMRQWQSDSSALVWGNYCDSIQITDDIREQLDAGFYISVTDTGIISIVSPLEENPPVNRTKARIVYINYK